MSGGKSLKVLVGDVKVRMGEVGVLDGKAVELVLELEKVLGKMGEEVWEKEEVKLSNGKEKKLDVKGIESLIKMSNLGVSNNEIGRRLGIVGMMVGNIKNGKLYKNEMEECRKKGVVLNKK